MQWTASSPATAQTITIGVNKDKTLAITYFPNAPTVVEELNGTRNVRYFERATAVVGGRWFAVSFYGLGTAVWNGAAWETLVEEKRGEAMIAKDSRIDAIATDGTRAWAVTTGGAIFEWDGKAWTSKLAEGGELFAKQRRFARLAWDGKRERLVFWGGDNGNRSSNDTLLFEGKQWRKSSKPGTKLSARKADNYWLYDDTARGGVVRVGPEGCHVLDGDAWKPIDLAAPPFLTGNADAQATQMIVAHDPASQQTRWIDPHTGGIYDGAKRVAEAGAPPGLVTTTVLKEAGGYFGGDFERANDRDWLWGWDPAKRRAYGTRLGSTKVVCELDASAAF